MVVIDSGSGYVLCSVEDCGGGEEVVDDEEDVVGGEEERECGDVSDVLREGSV